ncbi:MAG: Crp/Fnr family transcriptional regulator [Kiritimatiellia bacterium]
MSFSEQERQFPLDVSRVMAILNQISLLGGLTDEQLHRIFPLLGSMHHKEGTMIFEQGGRPSHIYIVQSGRVKMVVDVDGTTMELIEFGTGQCFGETSVIGIQPHSATAVAMEDTELIILSREAIHSLYKTDKDIFGMVILNIAREACRRLYKTDEILLHYALGKKAGK